MGLDKNIRQVIGGFAAERPAKNSADDEFDFADVLTAVWRRRSLVAILALAGVALAWVELQRTTPLYTAEALVLWDVEEENVSGLKQITPGLTGDWMELGSQIEIVRSGRLLGRVVDDLDIANDTILNGSYSTAPGWARWFSLGTYVGLVRGLFPLGEADARVDTADERRAELIDTVRGMVDPEWLDGTYVLNIRATTAGAQSSARLANELARLYILDQLETKFEATQQATDWLTARVSDLRVELEAAESRVEAFSSDTTLISEDALELSARQLKDLRQRSKSLLGDAEMARKTLDRVRTARDENRFGDVAAALRDARLERLAAQIGGADGASSGELDGAAIARFDSAARLQIDRLAGEADRAEAQRNTILASVAELEQDLALKSAALVEQRQLIREAEASRLIYEFFLGRLKEISVQEGIQQPDGRILTEARVPWRPSSPARLTTLLTGGLGGLLLGVLAGLLLERMNTSFRSADEIETRTGRSVIGTLPLAPVSGRRQVLQYLIDKPNSQFAEAVRNLRTSILLANVDRPPKVIMTTSSMPGEGKTTTCLALARMSQTLGKRTLLIECDLRRRTFRSYFDLPTKSGLMSVLSGQAEIDDALTHDEQSGLWVLAGEQSPVSAADVFSSKAFGDFIASMREQFDFVLIDTPPVLAVPDARVIAKHADAVLFITRWNRTPREVVDEALRLFSQIHVDVAGLVLTQVDQRRIKRYGRGYGYYREASKYYVS